MVLLCDRREELLRERFPDGNLGSALRAQRGVPAAVPDDGVDRFSSACAEKSTSGVWSALCSDQLCVRREEMAIRVLPISLIGSAPC